MRGAIHLHFFNTPPWRSARLKHKENFAFIFYLLLASRCTEEHRKVSIIVFYSQNALFFPAFVHISRRYVTDENIICVLRIELHKGLLTTPRDPIGVG